MVLSLVIVLLFVLILWQGYQLKCNVQRMNERLASSADPIVYPLNMSKVCGTTCDDRAEEEKREKQRLEQEKTYAEMMQEQEELIDYMRLLKDREVEPLRDLYAMRDKRLGDDKITDYMRSIAGRAEEAQINRVRFTPHSLAPYWGDEIRNSANLNWYDDNQDLEYLLTGQP